MEKSKKVKPWKWISQHLSGKIDDWLNNAKRDEMGLLERSEIKDWVNIIIWAGIEIYLLCPLPFYIYALDIQKPIISVEANKRWVRSLISMWEDEGMSLINHPDYYIARLFKKINRMRKYNSHLKGNPSSGNMI